MKNISRRDFIKYLGVGTVGLMTKPKIPFAGKKDGRQTSDVIQCFDETATSGSSVNQTTVQIMMDESIKTVTGVSDVGEAWKSIFPGIVETSIIGIKVNCINSAVPTRPELVTCIVDGLAQMEFGANHYQRNNIILWDRSDSELSSSGYTIYTGTAPNTVRCFGTSHSGVGYDGSVNLDVPGGPVNPSRILSILCDYLVNVAVLKNHGTAQVTLTMKNHYGSTSPVPSHATYCNPAIPALNQQIRDVITPNNIQKVFIIDALWASILSGPGGSPSWNPKKIIMSLDTVACDYQGWNIINEERVASGYSEIAWPVYHIQTAAQSPYDLGTIDINLIEINNPTAITETKTIQLPDNTLKIHPNPFRHKTTITLDMNIPSTVYLDLIDTSGRIQKNIYQGHLASGYHKLRFNVNKSLTSGTYFIRLYKQGKTTFLKVTILN